MGSILAEILFLWSGNQAAFFVPGGCRPARQRKFSNSSLRSFPSAFTINLMECNSQLRSDAV